MDAERPFLSLVIPAHDEANRLPAALDRALAFASRQPYDVEILVVENGSRDGTWGLARNAAARHPSVRALRLPEAGKGAAVRLGMLEAHGDYRFFCDADFSMPLAEVDHFLPPALRDVDVAIGSREASGSQRFDEPAHRHLMGRVFNRCVQLAVLPGIEDTQCGFKCFTARAAEEVFSRTSLGGFGFDVEALAIARRRGFRIVEVPIPWTHDEDSRVRILRDSIGMFLDVVRVALRVRSGRYDAAPRPLGRGPMSGSAGPTRRSGGITADPAPVHPLDEGDPMIVHGGKPSPFARKVVVALEEKGLRYESRGLAPFPKTPELLAMSPLGKIPILEHEDLRLPDSSVICAYLERIHPEKRLYPEDPVRYAQALFLEEYADTKMAEAIGGVFFERFVKKLLFQQEPDEALVQDRLANAVPEPLDFLESRLEPGAVALLGEFSIADIAVGAQLGGLHLAGEKIDSARWPKLASYGEQLLARPSFQVAMDVR